MRILSMLQIGALMALASPLASAQILPGPVGCPVNGFSTSDYGTGSGFIAPMQAFYGFDGANCEVDIKIQAASCCNTYFVEFYLMYGENPLAPGFPLPEPPFWTGSELLILPDAIEGPFSGNTGDVAIPNNPLLPGMTFYLQALGVWFTTIGFSYDYGVSQGTKLTFQ